LDAARLFIFGSRNLLGGRRVKALASVRMGLMGRLLRGIIICVPDRAQATTPCWIGFDTGRLIDLVLDVFLPAFAVWASIAVSFELGSLQAAALWVAVANEILY
jgi:hypothetical protein